MGRGIGGTRRRRSFAKENLHVLAIRLLGDAFDEKTTLPYDRGIYATEFDGALIVTNIKQSRLR